MSDSLPLGHTWRVEIDTEYLHYCRVSKGWTVKQLADRMNGHVSTLSGTCKRRRCTLDYLERIATALDINPLSLMVAFPIPKEVALVEVEGKGLLKRQPNAPLRTMRDWTPQEEDILKQLALAYGHYTHKWEKIGKHMKRSPHACRNKWYLIRRRDEQTTNELDGRGTGTDEGANGTGQDPSRDSHSDGTHRVGGIHQDTTHRQEGEGQAE
jgi:transcriptional regulator with XRE-family HTH domain